MFFRVMRFETSSMNMPSLTSWVQIPPPWRAPRWWTRLDVCPGSPLSSLMLSRPTPRPKSVVRSRTPIMVRFWWRLGSLFPKSFGPPPGTRFPILFARSLRPSMAIPMPADTGSKSAISTLRRVVLSLLKPGLAYFIVRNLTLHSWCTLMTLRLVGPRISSLKLGAGFVLPQPWPKQVYYSTTLNLSIGVSDASISWGQKRLMGQKVKEPLTPFGGI